MLGLASSQITARSDRRATTGLLVAGGNVVPRQIRVVAKFPAGHESAYSTKPKKLATDHTWA